MLLQKVLTSRPLLHSIRSNCSKLNTSKTTFSTSARLALRQGGRNRVNTQTQSKFGEKAITTGQYFAAGTSLAGMGALCYYGMGMSKETSAIDKAVMWPQYVRQRIKDTYMYFGASLGLTGISAYAIAQNPTLMRLATSNSIMGMFASLALLWGSSMLCRSIDYKPGFNAKQMTWLLHTAVVGGIIAPLTLLGGPLMVRAAMYTMGVAGGISTVAYCAPSEKFLNWGGPLAAGFGVVFLASIGGAFLPPTSAAGMTLYSISMYGGLALFSALLLYNTQKAVKKAESYPLSYSGKQYDPINASMGMYMNVINIFVRIAVMLAQNKGNSRR